MTLVATRTSDLFALERVPAPLRWLLEVERPWEALARLDAFLADLEDRREGRIHPTAVVEGNVYLAPGAEIQPHAYVVGPSWIGEGAIVGHGAFLRGWVVMAPGARVLHASEAKRSLLLPGARAPHFNYVGDSILGSDVNLGAGVKLANFKSLGSTVIAEGEDTGLRKFGAAVGDDVAVGCNAVLAPGTIVGRESVLYHGVMVRGTIPARSVVKLRQQHERVLKRSQ